jgi:ABC-type sulfate transport system permease component
VKTVLIVLTLVELGLLVAVLAVYLLSIASTLRTVARTLGLVTFGVRAIEKQTEPLGPVLRDVNESLEQVAELLGIPPARERIGERTVEAVEHGAPQQVSGSGS